MAEQLSLEPEIQSFREYVDARDYSARLDQLMAMKAVVDAWGVGRRNGEWWIQFRAPVIRIWRQESRVKEAGEKFDGSVGF